jgi:energy-coupling factor transport system permease protein
LKRSILDPRSKLIITFVAMALLMIFSHWAFLAISLGLLFILLLLFRFFRPWFNFLKGLGVAVLTFFLIAWLAFDLQTGIVSGLRLLTIGTVFFLFFQTTPVEHLSNGLLKMGFPYAFTFVLSASMQFIPVLIRRARNIRDAQRARGIPMDGGPRSILYLPAFAGPLLIQSFKFADELAEAMEARGFGISGRSFRYEPHFRWIDWVVVAVSLIVLITALLANFLITL